VRDRLDAALAEAYVALGRTGDAMRISAWLRETGGRLGRPALTGNADRIDALAHAQAGDLDAAAEKARAAVAAHGSSPLRLELARSLLALGRIERRRKARRQSREALSRARKLAAAIGHQPLLTEIERELPRVAAARSGTELTATEQRVAGLIASGATNSDAAAALFVSVRTVETHVASIYRKLGVRTRAELARGFLKAGLPQGTEATYATSDGKTFINIVESDAPDMVAASTYAPFFDKSEVFSVVAVDEAWLQAIQAAQANWA
jgi:DNA-binding CsgD family transcriptional regulator